jgi:hypothetical protein
LQTPARVLDASTAITYSPRSLIVISCADESAGASFIKRLFPAQTLLSKAAVSALVEGRVPAAQLEEATEKLFADALAKRLVAGRPAVIATETLTATERAHLLEIADKAKRSAHLIVLDTGRQAISDDAVFYQLQALVVSARSGAVGLEGFRTALVLGRTDVEALRTIEFVLPRQRH